MALSTEPGLCYANTHLQPLAQHLALVGLTAKRIVEHLTKPGGGQERWGQMALMAGIFHDIGKADPNFQEFLLKKKCSSVEDQDGVHISDGTQHSFAEYPRHNEVSWALVSAHLDQKGLCSKYLKGAQTVLSKDVRYAVYWHHAKPLRDPEDQKKFESSEQILELVGDWLPRSLPTIRAILDEACLLANQPKMEDLLSSEYSGVSENTPGFKDSFEDVNCGNLKQAVLTEARRSLIRSALVTADRHVSKLSAQELAEHLAYFAETGSVLLDLDWLSGFEPAREGTLAQVVEMVAQFNDAFPSGERNRLQADAARKLASANVSVLQGPAGCGKTKIMLEYLGHVQKGRQCFVFVPRTAIADGLYRELTGEYGITRSVEVVVSGSRLKTRMGKEVVLEQGEEFGSDIVITTFDQLCAVALSHRRIDLLTRVLSSTVVFDEFHELFDISGLVLLFLELMKLRLDGTAKTLLVSATPAPYFYQTIKELDCSTGAPLKVVALPSFNEEPFTFNAQSYSEDEGQEHPYCRAVAAPGDIFISNKASTAQQAAVAALKKKVPALCFHSKFTPKDKREVLNAVLSSFGKASGSHTTVLFSGPIVQASLNISTRHLHTEATHAENFLQRLGRANRFGNFGGARVTVYRKTSKDTPAGGVDSTLLSKMSQKNRAVAWNRFMEHNGVLNKTLSKTLSIAEIYHLYDRFHQEPGTADAYAQDFKKVLESSAKTFKDKNFDPLQLPAPKSAQKGQKKLSANALRGESYYLNVRRTEVLGKETRTSGWLWNESSEQDELLTDELLFLRYAEEADKAAIQGLMASSEPAHDLFRAGLPEPLLKKRKRLKKIPFFKWMQLARNPATPMVASLPKGSKKAANVQREYLVFQNVLIGLTKPLRNLP